MDNTTKVNIIRLTKESIIGVRTALVAATEAGAGAEGMYEYIRAIKNLEDALAYFEDDDDNGTDEVTPDHPGAGGSTARAMETFLRGAGDVYSPYTSSSNIP